MIAPAALNATSRTLLIPLVGRAVAQNQYPSGSFADSEAAELLARLERECPSRALEPLKRDRLIVLGTIRRTEVFDGITRSFIAQNPEATVVNLGAGLCTRFSRVDNGRIRWIDIDIAEVADLRRELLPPGPRQRIASAESDWLTLVEAGAPVLILSEGVLMFLTRPDAEVLVRRLSMRLPTGSEWAFDYIHPFFARYDALRPRSMKQLSARYQWGVRQISDLIPSGSRFEIISEKAFTDAFSPPMRLAERALRRVLHGPLFDVAHLRVR